MTADIAELATALEQQRARIVGLEETLRAARVIIVEDANACRAFRDESEGPSGPENVLVKIDAALAKAIEGDRS